MYSDFVIKLKKILPRRVFKTLLFIKHIPDNFYGFYLMKKYSFLNKHFKTSGVTRERRSVPIIMSDTTFPARINTVYLSIETIMRQKVKPDKILLWLAKNEFPKGRIGLPKKLLALEKRGLEIKFSDENYRSNNKLFHTLKENPDAVIITFDDDCFYPTTYIKDLYEKHLQHPRDIIGYDAMQIKTDKLGNLLPYSSWFDYKRTSDARDDTFLLSVNGILYPPKSIHKEAFNGKILKKIAWYNDDIWFKAMSLLQGSRHRRLKKRNIQFPSIPNTQQFGLYHINVNEDRNNQIAKDVFNEYNLSKKFKKNSIRFKKTKN